MRLHTAGTSPAARQVSRSAPGGPNLQSLRFSSPAEEDAVARPTNRVRMSVTPLEDRLVPSVQDRIDAARREAAADAARWQAIVDAQIAAANEAAVLAM